MFTIIRELLRWNFRRHRETNNNDKLWIFAASFFINYITVPVLWMNFCSITRVAEPMTCDVAVSSSTTIKYVPRQDFICWNLSGTSHFIHIDVLWIPPLLQILHEISLVYFSLIAYYVARSTYLQTPFLKPCRFWLIVKVKSYSLKYTYIHNSIQPVSVTGCRQRARFYDVI